MTGRAVERLDENEIKQVVDGLVKGQIYTAFDCPPDMIPMVFMVVGMGGLGEYDLATVGCVYEWLDRAGERGINGCPMFLSCKVVHTDDWKLILEKAVKVEQAMKAAME
jgi:hypothetical protein